MGSEHSRLLSPFSLSYSFCCVCMLIGAGRCIHMCVEVRGQFVVGAIHLVLVCSFVFRQGLCDGLKENGCPKGVALLGGAALLK